MASYTLDDKSLMIAINCYLFGIAGAMLLGVVVTLLLLVVPIPHRVTLLHVGYRTLFHVLRRVDRIVEGAAL